MTLLSLSEWLYLLVLVGARECILAWPVGRGGNACLRAGERMGVGGTGSVLRLTTGRGAAGTVSALEQCYLFPLASGNLLVFA